MPAGVQLFMNHSWP